MELYVIRQTTVCMTVYIGMILVGYGMGWSAPVIPKLQDPDLTPLPDVITDGQASWIASVLYIGTIIGPYVTGYLSNKSGRKPSLILAGFLTALSFLILALANNLIMILAGRIIIGLGTGMIFVVNLVYIGEIASTNVRGIFLTGTGIFSTMGTLIVYSVSPYVSYPAVSWVGLGITVGYIGGLFFIPESPVFQVLKGQEKEAAETLSFLGRENDIDQVMSKKIEQENVEKGEWRTFITDRSTRKALFITLTLNILQQMSGVVAVSFFVTTIFQMAGSSIEPYIATIIIGVTQLGASCITPFFVESVGRKVLLITSTASCCFSLAVLGLYFFLDLRDVTAVASIRWLPLVTLILFFLSYDLGFGIIPGVFIGEMFQPKVRSTGSAITITTAWLAGFGVSTAFGYVISAVGGHVVFWVFATFCGLACLFTAVFVPETKGKTFAEIQEMLLSK